MKSLLDLRFDIQEEDILTGRDSAAAVFARTARRIEVAYIDLEPEQEIDPTAQLAPVPHWASHLPSGVRLLNTAGELRAEGAEMQHCVASYIGAVRRGECHILSLTTSAGRSTAEIPTDLRVVQHYGPRNSKPAEENTLLLETAIESIKGAKNV